ncbi:IS110 family transposase [Pseudomonas fluorescens]|uniref:IS110 family transposase n=1 Tax=Pseudomonas fluorescens TaxID=294 RepID=UPI000CA38D1B|nr:IS110 family transposase [Pseudomonas fluorescens]AUM68341.1 IS110 family transposase [Pseudomonas fluorescens]AUM68831.1 IS110 family transposase [Pseudomonas fluorescens]AUM68832.1 IS110 family transposase [Pseudomonas fluorescens]AUM68835.1 IS110 family transposase [Pseudomonas fluorescens]
MKFCGIDLHSNNSVVVVTDETDRVLVSRRCPNELTPIIALLDPHRDELAGVVVESTYNWYWLVDGLMAAGLNVKLANPVAMKRYDGLKHSDDKDDAVFLAHLLRLGILPTGYIHPPHERALRDLARKRIQLVRTRTQHILAVENIAARQFGHSFSCNEIKGFSAASVDRLGLPIDVALAMKANVVVIQALEAQIAELDARLLQQAKLRPEYLLLKTMPGVGEVLATIIMLETGDIDRFAEVGNFASYARCVKSAHYSNGKKKGEGNAKNGNAYLIWAFIEAANFARRFSDDAKRFFEKKKAKTNSVIATKALAHKLARASYYILKEKQPFDAKRCFA